MTIQRTILINSILLIIVIMSLGQFSRKELTSLGSFAKDGQEEMGKLALSIYDNAFMGVNYARKSQIDWLKFIISHPPGKPSTISDESKAILDTMTIDLGVAAERSIKDSSRELAQKIQAQIKSVSDPSSAPLSVEQTEDITTSINKLCNRFANDASDYRDKVETLETDNSQKLSSTLNDVNRLLLIALGSSVGIAFIMAYILRRAVIPPILALTTIMERLASKDFSVVIEIKRKDEIARMAKTVQVFKEALQREADLLIDQEKERQKLQSEKKALFENLTNNFDTHITDFLKDLTISARALSASSQELTTMSQSGRGRSEELAEASEIASHSVGAMSSMSDQMSRSIQDINDQISNSREISSVAVSKSANASRNIARLEEIAAKISDVVKLIGAIAGQTNLLALNATIEAARAGEAGKGFAVVASEVKNLATQTASATTDISAQVSEVVGAIKETVEVINGIGQTIAEIDHSSAAIAASIEKQSMGMAEMLGSMQSAAESTKKTQEIGLTVSEISQNTEKVASNLNNAANDLAQKNRVIRDELEIFLSNLKIQ